MQSHNALSAKIIFLQPYFIYQIRKSIFKSRVTWYNSHRFFYLFCADFGSRRYGQDRSEYFQSNNGRFDFVIYEKEYGGGEKPILAIELDGKEHQDESLVKQRDRQKTEVCRTHGFELIRVENSYARRYYYIKGILEEYFRKIR